MELIQEWVFIAPLIAIVVSTATGCWSILSSSKCNRKAIEQTRALAEKQTQFQIFTEYTKRYQDLVLRMPTNLDCKSIQSTDVDIYMRLYFDLCSEEFYLHAQGMIDDYVWELWTDGMRTAMKREKYRTSWKLLGQYYNDTSFAHFINDLTRG